MARRRNMRTRAWIGGICIGSIVLTGMFVTVAATWRDDRAQLREMLEDSEGSNRAIKDRIVSLDRELEHAWAGLYAAERIRDQPDWSILLAAVAARTGEQIVLARIGLERPAPTRPLSRTPEGVAAAQPRPQPRDLVLSGTGVSAHQVSLFSVRLEELSLFSRVIIQQSARDQTGLEGAIAFTMRCTLIEEVD
ncbi:MAG: hypothetical protein IH985_06665 [Planctomycetes bacterium]|nr:hypothetical protein [Planctomycetota bacterium]